MLIGRWALWRLQIDCRAMASRLIFSICFHVRAVKLQCDLGDFFELLRKSRAPKLTISCRHIQYANLNDKGIYILPEKIFFYSCKRFKIRTRLVRIIKIRKTQLERSFIHERNYSASTIHLRSLLYPGDME